MNNNATITEVLEHELVAQPQYTTDDWGTPKWLCELLGTFDTDPCSNPRSHVKAHQRIQLEDVTDAQRAELAAIRDVTSDVWIDKLDGLTAPWVGSVFCNPPYSDPLPWARRLAAHGGPWVALLKLDTTTRWWATLMDSGAQWAPFRSRLKFEQPGKAMTANFASVLCFSRWAPSRELAKHLWLPTYAKAIQ